MDCSFQFQRHYSYNHPARTVLWDSVWSVGNLKRQQIWRAKRVRQKREREGGGAVTKYQICIEINRGTELEKKEEEGRISSSTRDDFRMTDGVIVSQRLIKGKKSNPGDKREMIIIGERKPWEGGIFHAEGDTDRQTDRDKDSPSTCFRLFYFFVK